MRADGWIVVVVNGFERPRPPSPPVWERNFKVHKWLTSAPERRSFPHLQPAGYQPVGSLCVASPARKHESSDPVHPETPRDTSGNPAKDLYIYSFCVEVHLSKLLVSVFFCTRTQRWIYCVIFLLWVMGSCTWKRNSLPKPEQICSFFLNFPSIWTLVWVGGATRCTSLHQSGCSNVDICGFSYCLIILRVFHHV